MTPGQRYELDRALHWRSLLNKAVEEKGEDFRYTPVEYTDLNGLQNKSCRYFIWEGFKPKAPSCIVGHGIWYDSDIAVEDISSNIEGTGVVKVLTNILNTPEPVVVLEALEAAQNRQDKRVPWGEALAEYDRHCLGAITGYAEAIGRDTGSESVSPGHDS